MLGKLTPVTKNIILLNVIVYVLVNFVLDTESMYRLLSGFYPLSPNFRLWQPITHMFMHAEFSSGMGISHILFNMFTFWSFGPVLEQTLGNRKFAALYFASGLGAFFLFNVYYFLRVQGYMTDLEAFGVNPAVIFQKAAFSAGAHPTAEIPAQAVDAARGLMEILRTPMVGASGAIFGVVAAFSTLFPDARMIFLFVPFPIKAKYLFPAIIVISLYLGYHDSMSNIAHFAHIGGAVTGFLMAMYWRKNLHWLKRR